MSDDTTAVAPSERNIFISDNTTGTVASPTAVQNGDPLFLAAPTIEEHPYEILLRFNWEQGERAGALKGISVEQKRFLVGADGLIQGRLDRGTDDHPKEFPADRLQELLGEKFLALEAGQRDAQEQLAAKTAEHLKLSADHTNLISMFGEVQAQLAAANGVIKQAVNLLQAEGGG